MTNQSSTNAKRLRLRYDGTCSVCGVSLPARTEAIYERTTKTIRCLAHDISSEVKAGGGNVDIGTPGASARREFERRKVRRERRLRTKHPKIGGLLLAISNEPHSTTAWDTGALGEERLGDRLNKLASDEFRVLHDRRIPGSRANIDHLAVTPSGVYVIDAKKYTGRPRLKMHGGLLREREEMLLVGTRDCTKLVDGVIKQVDVVANALGNDIPVAGVLCFIDADWPLFGGSFSTRGVSVLWPKKLSAELGADGSISRALIGETHLKLAAALPPA